VQGLQMIPTYDQLTRPVLRYLATNPPERMRTPYAKPLRITRASVNSRESKRSRALKELAVDGLGRVLNFVCFDYCTCFVSR